MNKDYESEARKLKQSGNNCSNSIYKVFMDDYKLSGNGFEDFDLAFLTLENKKKVDELYKQFSFEEYMFNNINNFTIKSVICQGNISHNKYYIIYTTVVMGQEVQTLNMY